MPELSLIEIIKYTVNTVLSSKVLVLFLLELAIFILGMFFSKLMAKKVVKNTCIFASILILGFYITNYIQTIRVFLDNVSTKFIELLYFPTTLEFVIVMLSSIVIMLVTLKGKKNKIGMKVINTIIPLSISFLFLSIIEYINSNQIPFDEFSVFTNPILMSLYEFAMVIYITWLIGLLVYKIDVFIIASIKEPREEDNSYVIDLPKIKEKQELEMPKLKEVQ